LTRAVVKKAPAAKTSAERQADYRARRATAGEDGNGDRRLDVWVSTGANLALERLACRHKLTKREMLERLITQADDAITRKLEPDTPKWDSYFKGE